MNIDQLYQQALQSLAPSERLRLATMLLETVSPAVVVDQSEEWSEQDIREYRDHCRRRRAAPEIGEETDGDSQAG